MNIADQDAEAWYMALPRKRVSAACILRDTSNKVLLVKPTYKVGWELPGGGVEQNESPLDACRREVEEELGLTRAAGRLLAVDYQRAVPGVRDDALSLIFDGGILTSTDVAQIRLATEEVSAWRFVTRGHLSSFLLPEAARCVAALMAASMVTFFVDGEEG